MPGFRFPLAEKVLRTGSIAGRPIRLPRLNPGIRLNAPTAFPDQQKPVPPYKHTPLFPLGKDKTPYKKITSKACGSRR